MPLFRLYLTKPNPIDNINGEQLLPSDIKEIVNEYSWYSAFASIIKESKGKTIPAIRIEDTVSGRWIQAKVIKGGSFLKDEYYISISYMTKVEKKKLGGLLGSKIMEVPKSTST